MRFVLQFLFLLLLAVALFGGEVAESTCLVNDVSNDYIQAPPASLTVSQFLDKRQPVR
jgi:hypothetical protein